MRIRWFLAVAGVLTLLAQPALAHEDEDLPAKTLVEQAIALLRSQPEQREAIEDKMHDAVEAKDTKGVDLDLVREAHEVFESGDRHGAWDFLEEAIGAAPHRVVVDPNEAPGQPAPSPVPQPTPTLHELELAGSEQRPSGSAVPILLGIAAVVVAGGLVIAWRVR